MNGWGKRTHALKEPRNYICDYCGEAFEARVRARYCPDCRRLARLEYAEERRRLELQKKRDRQANHFSWEKVRYEVVRDPDDEGGFPRGARLTYQELKQLLADGYLTPGMVLRDRKRGDVLRVFGARLQAQTLVPEVAG